MTRGSFFPFSSRLAIVPSFASVLKTKDGSCLSGDAPLGVDFPLVPPSGFFSRSFIERTGAGQEYFGTGLAPYMVLSNTVVRSSHGGTGVVFDCLPPRRFLVAFST